MNPRFLLNSLLSIILPPQCHICGRPLPASRRFLCADCLASLPLAGYDPLSSPITDRLLPLRQAAGKGTAFLRYEPGNAAAQLIQDFKYHGFSLLAKELGKEAAVSLELTGIFDDIDFLLPIPLHFTKRIKRGYNQSEMIARGISEVTGIPISRTLQAVKPHSTQTRLSARERMSNVKGIFKIKKPETLVGKKVLLIDDVFTTGATLLEAAGVAASSCPGVTVSVLALATAFR